MYYHLHTIVDTNMFLESLASFAAKTCLFCVVSMLVTTADMFVYHHKHSAPFDTNLAIKVARLP